MTKDQSQSELEKLRMEVAQLREAQKVQAVNEASTESTLEEPVEVKTEQKVSIEENGDDPEALDTQAEPNEQAQIDELMSLVSKEIKDLPTVTTLAVFSLGLLMGRYLR